MYSTATASLSVALASQAHSLRAMMFQTDPTVDDLINQLPPEVIEQLPADVLRGLQDGTLNEIPAEVKDRLKERVSAEVYNRIPDSLLPDGTDMRLVAIFAAIGLVALGGFFWGVMKSAMKAALFFAVAAAGAAYLLYRNVE